MEETAKFNSQQRKRSVLFLFFFNWGIADPSFVNLVTLLTKRLDLSADCHPPPFEIIYLFIYFWLHWIFIASHRLPLVVASVGYSLVAVLRFLIAVASLAADFGLQGTQAQ